MRQRPSQSLLYQGFVSTTTVNDRQVCAECLNPFFIRASFQHGNFDKIHTASVRLNPFFIRASFQLCTVLNAPRSRCLNPFFIRASFQPMYEANTTLFGVSQSLLYQGFVSTQIETILPTRLASQSLLYQGFVSTEIGRVIERLIQVSIPSLSGLRFN